MSSSDIALAAQSTATVVILMGLHKLDEIVQIYAELGKIEEPIAIIQNGSMQNQKIVTRKISNIQPLSRISEMASPAIIVIGNVASLPDLSFEQVQEMIRKENLISE